jgi:hypothetical protein
MSYKNICLACNLPITDKDFQYHPACIKFLFGQKNVPELPYTNTDIKNWLKKLFAIA